jgi:threonine efflux protein
MQELIVLGTLAATFFVLIASPGPNFLVITQLATSKSRVHGMCTGLGVATGSIVWATLAATGLGVIFAGVPWSQPLLQFVGGCYLVYIGVKVLRGARQTPKGRDLSQQNLDSFGRAYRFGLITNMTNPKALAFYTSVFTSLIRPELAPWLKLAGVGVIAVMSISWFVLLATVFSIPAMQAGYRRAKFGIDIVTGTCMVGFGLHLLWLLVPQLQTAA